MVKQFLIMKKLLFIFVLLQLSISFAQRPNGSGRGGNAMQMSGKQERPKFESAKIAGFIEHSPKKVIKKLKLNKKDTIAKALTSYLDAYNKKITNIKIKNKDLLEGLDIVVNQNMETAMKSRNRELMQSTMAMVQEKLNPIRDEIKLHDDALNVFFEALLTEEQYKKWSDYQKSERQKLMPKQRATNDARNRPDNLNSGQRRRG